MTTAIATAELFSQGFRQFDAVQEATIAGRSAVEALVAYPTGKFKGAMRQAHRLIAVENCVRVFRRFTESTHERIKWFSDTAEQLEAATDTADSTAFLSRLDEITQLTHDGLDLAEQGRDLMAKIGMSHRARERRRRIGNELIDALRMQIQAIERVRWAVMEMEADVDIASGDLSTTFNSADDLLSSVRD